MIEQEATAAMDGTEVRGRVRWERPEQDPGIMKAFFGPFSAGIVFQLQGGWVCALAFDHGAMGKHPTEAAACNALETAVREAFANP